MHRRIDEVHGDFCYFRIPQDSLVPETLRHD